MFMSVASGRKSNPTLRIPATSRRSAAPATVSKFPNEAKVKNRIFFKLLAAFLIEITAEEAQAAGARATVIDASGKVLADSESNPATMENHAGRPEFVAALAGKTGSNERRSATLGIPFLYVATPISGGAVRLAYPLSDLKAVQSQVRRRLLWGSALALLIALLGAAWASILTAHRLQRIVDVAARIERGDLRARVDDP